MAGTAVVLLNLGGPDSPEAVQPFLRNLFGDPAILRVPGVVRWFLSRLIASRRAPFARESYAKIGGRSPLLEHTRAQATALAEALADAGEVRVFTAMRYWHPMSEETAAEVALFDPDEVVLLPLYPQYSTTTTASSVKAWRRAARIHLRPQDLRLRWPHAHRRHRAGARRRSQHGRQLLRSPRRRERIPR